MGIKGLFQLLEREAPNSFRMIDIKVFTGKTVCCDASNVMYSFMATTGGAAMSGGEGTFDLTDKEGNPTAHLLGLYNRTISFLENKIKPIWVFDGKPPELKMGELKKRAEAKAEAKDQVAELKDTGNIEQMQKMKKRNIRITSKMTEDAKKMLGLMGMPVVESLCEAEAQCVVLVKASKADAVASEDMDCLTFGATLQLKGFTQRKDKRDPIVELELDIVLKELDLTMDEFIDLCILCGCDYTKPIEGLGHFTAFKMIKEHRTIEKVLEDIKRVNEEKVKDGKNPKYTVPDGDRYNFQAARDEFKACKSFPADDIKIEFNDPDEEGLKKFLCEEKQFSLGRIEGGLEKLKVAKKSGVQSTLESFFGKPTKIIASGAKKGPKDKNKESMKISAKRK